MEIFAKLAWLILCINMWGFAIFGLLLAAGGAFAEVNGSWEMFRPFDADIVSTDQKVGWFALNLALSALGVIFIWLQTTKRIRFDSLQN